MYIPHETRHIKYVPDEIRSFVEILHPLQKGCREQFCCAELSLSLSQIETQLFH